jgi:hypothetical protein
MILAAWAGFISYNAGAQVLTVSVPSLAPSGGIFAKCGIP